MKNLPYRILSKEPVMLGAAAIAVFEAAEPGASPAWKLAVGAIVAWGVRILSTPEARAKERVATASTAARHKALADVASLQPAKPARGATKKTAPATRR